MKNERKTEIKVGLTVLASLIILLFILGWAKNITFGSDRKILNVEFGSVAGLNRGDEVSVNGLRKGTVEEITISGNKVMVSAVLDEDTDLKEDATFSIMMLDLMGGKKIEVNPGDSDVSLDLSVVHQGEFVGDISTAMAMLSSVQFDLVDVIKEVKISLNALNSLIGDDEFSDDLKSTLLGLQSLTEKVNNLIDDNARNLNQLIKSGSELSKQAAALIDENREGVKKTLEDVSVLMKNSNELVQRVDKLVSDTENKKNNAGKLLYDEQLVSDIKKALEELRGLTKILVDQLENEGLKVDAYIF